MNEPRDEQQLRVLDVAIELFAEHGFDDVTMADIAEAAEVARATVFNYFGSKHGLVETVTETVIVFYREMLDEALNDERTRSPDQLRWLYEEMGKGIEAHRRLFRSVFREIARIGLGLDEGSIAQRANEEAITRLRTLIARGQARGELDDSFDSMTLATAFRSLANGTITNWLYEDAADSLVARMRAAADIFLSPVEQARRPTRRSRRKGDST
ncbi:MAG: TetR/AcrR family transcriptional regulator [Acidimicrobiia bacterium]